MKPEALQTNIYKRFVHPLIAVGNPFFFVITFTVVLQQVDFLQLNVGPLHFLFILAAGVFKVLLNLIFRKEHVERINVLREFVLTAGVCYVLFSLLRSGPLSQRFYPAPANIFSLLLVIIQWWTTFRLHQLFHNRELFLDVIAGKDREALLKAIRQSAQLARDAYQDLLQFRYVFIAQGAVIFVLLCLPALAGIPLAWSAIAWVGVFMFGLFLTVMVINLFKQEYRELGEGFRFSSITQRRRSWYAVFFLLACIVLALLFADSQASLKLPNLQLPALPTTRPAPLPPRPTMAPRPPQLPPSEDSPSWLPDLSWLFVALAPFFKIFLILFLAAALLLPFFSKDFLRWMRSKRFLRFLLDKLAGFKGLLLTLFGDIRDFFRLLFLRRSLHKEEQQLSKAGAKLARDRQHRSFRQRLETNRVMRLFLRLLSWGRKRGVRYYHHQTVLEYCDNLQQKYPGLREPLARIVEIFDEALYANHPLERGKLNTYRDAIRAVTKQSVK